MDKAKNKQWTIIFLGITALALFLEIFESFEGNPNTIPWTKYIVTYVPVWIGLPIIIGFAIWLIIHFVNKYYSELHT